MTYGGSGYSSCLSRSIGRLSPDRDVKFVSKLVLRTTSFSKKPCWIPLDQLVELKTTTWRVERQNLYPTWFILKGMSSFVRVEERQCLLHGSTIYSIFDLSLGYRQINLRTKDYLDVVLLQCFTWVDLHALWSDQYFRLVRMAYESIFLEYHYKVVVEPIDNILIPSMFEEIHIEHMALVLETCTN